MNDHEVSTRRSFRSELLRIHAQAPQQQWLTLLRSADEHEYTIEQLIARVGDYAEFYYNVGIQPNDLILIILKESLDLFASFFAAIIIGALPAYYAYPSPKHSVESFIESVENLIRYNEIKLVISFKEVIHVLNQIDRQLFPSCIGFYDHHAVQEQGNTNLERFPIPANEAFLQFSSGTTGAKKGVKISIDSLFNQIEAYSPYVNYSSQSKVVSWLPHYHDMGLIACMLMPFLKSVPIVMMSPFEWVSNPKMLFEAITKVRGTHVLLPNFLL
jgi:acyl-CoA synthetase (AMP-forming)/AMP-acid ligase II